MVFLVCLACNALSIPKDAGKLSEHKGKRAFARQISP
jgi:hypothetical protein